MKKTATNLDGFQIRFSQTERFQREFRDFCLDELVRPDHQVRTLWDYVSNAELSDS